jgi:uncharacterized protein YxjI
MLLDRKVFFIKEHVGFLKLTDTYDILDPETQAKIGLAKEEPHFIVKFLRLLVNKRMMPTTINVYEGESTQALLSIRRPFTFIRSKVVVRGATGETLGYFKSKLFSFGGGFWVYDAMDNQVAEVKGDWKGWNFKFLGAGGQEMGTVTKKWAGIGKELFTTADNYIISVGEGQKLSQAQMSLLLTAGLAIDTVYKEK